MNWKPATVPLHLQSKKYASIVIIIHIRHTILRVVLVYYVSGVELNLN